MTMPVNEFLQVTIAYETSLCKKESTTKIDGNSQKCGVSSQRDMALI